MTLGLWLNRTFVLRWAKSLSWLLRGARVHPSAVCHGEVVLAPGAKLAAQCVLSAQGTGRISLGAKVWCNHHVEIDTTGEVRIGAGTTVQRYASINGNVQLGVGCILAPSVFISSGTHPFRKAAHLPIRDQERLGDSPQDDQPVHIGDDCWLGVHAVVMPGVVIGRGVVVGANAVVTRDCPPYAVMAGSPARRIASRLQWLPPQEVIEPKDEHRPYLYAGWMLHPAVDGIHVELGNSDDAFIAVPWEATSVEVSLAGEGASRPTVVVLDALEPAFDSEVEHRFKLARLARRPIGQPSVRLLSWRCS